MWVAAELPREPRRRDGSPAPCCVPTRCPSIPGHARSRPRCGQGNHPASLGPFSPSLNSLFSLLLLAPATAETSLAPCSRGAAPLELCTPAQHSSLPSHDTALPRLAVTRRNIYQKTRNLLIALLSEREALPPRLKVRIRLGRTPARQARDREDPHGPSSSSFPYGCSRHAATAKELLPVWKRNNQLCCWYTTSVLTGSSQRVASIQYVKLLNLQHINCTMS